MTMLPLRHCPCVWRAGIALQSIRSPRGLRQTVRYQSVRYQSVSKDETQRQQSPASPQPPRPAPQGHLDTVLKTTHRNKMDLSETLGSWCYKGWNFLKLYLIGVQCLVSQVVYRVKRPKDVELQVRQPTVAIVTGGAKGIGLHVCRKLVKAGVHVVIGARDMDAASQYVSKTKEDFPEAKIEALELDLASFSSIRGFASKFLAKNLELNILINNAAIMMVPYRLTVDSWEEHFQVNYLGVYLLNSLLMDCLKQSGSSDRYSRIINVSSHVHYAGDFELERTANRPTYSCHSAYSQSKLAVVLYTLKLQRLLQESGSYVTVNTLHPGVVNTELFRHVGPIMRVVNAPVKCLFKTPEEGSITTVFLALSPSVEAIGGHYYDNCERVEPAKLSFDRGLQDRLWSLSEDAVKDREK